MWNVHTFWRLEISLDSSSISVFNVSQLRRRKNTTFNLKKNFLLLTVPYSIAKNVLHLQLQSLLKDIGIIWSSVKSMCMMQLNIHNVFITKSS